MSTEKAMVYGVSNGLTYDNWCILRLFSSIELAERWIAQAREEELSFRSAIQHCSSYSEKEKEKALSWRYRGRAGLVVDDYRIHEWPVDDFSSVQGLSADPYDREPTFLVR
jgi:hypothetical protein